MREERMVINTLDEAREVVHTLILFTSGSEHMSVIQGMYEVSPKLNIHQVNSIFLEELENSVITATRTISSNLSPGGSHIGRDLVITLTRF